MTGISHIVEIAGGSNVTQLDLFHTIGDLADDRRDNCAGRLTRPVSIERPCDGERQIESVEKAHRHCVGADLGRAVGRLRLERMLFVDGNVLRGTIDFTGRRVDDATHAIFKRCLADIEGTFDIGIDIAVRCNVGVGNCDQRSEVEDDINIFGNVLAVMRVTNIAV